MAQRDILARIQRGMIHQVSYCQEHPARLLERGKVQESRRVPGRMTNLTRRMLAIRIGPAFGQPLQSHRPAGASIASLNRIQRLRAFELKEAIECWRRPQLKAEDGFPRV